MIIDEQFLVSEKNSWMAAILDFYHQKNFFEGYIPGNKYSYIFLLCKNQTSGLCFWEQIYEIQSIRNNDWPCSHLEFMNDTEIM
jgi:hypothetical protein